MTTDLRTGLEAAIRAAKLALFVIRKQGVMPNSSWESGFNSDVKIAETALAELTKPSESKLPPHVKVGVSFHSGRDLWHVRAIVDDMAVCRKWFKTKQRWHYETLDAIWFEVFKPTFEAEEIKTGNAVGNEFPNNEPHN
jgi:FAD/FMN-containing dehydrogenase